MEKGRPIEFILKILQSYLQLHTVIVGDSIVDNLCIDKCRTISLLGGRLKDSVRLIAEKKFR